MRSALEHRFDPALSGKPYADHREHLQDLLSLLSLYLVIGVSFRSISPQQEPCNVLPGSAATAEQALDYLGDYPLPPPELSDETAAMLAAAHGQIAGRLAASGKELPYLRMQSLFALSDFSAFCVLCALGCAGDRAMEQLFVELHGENSVRYATLGTAYALYSLDHPGTSPFTQEVQQLLSSGMLFLPGQENTPELLRPLILRPQVAAYLRGESCLQHDPAITLIGPGDQAAQPLFLEEHTASLKAALHDSVDADQPGLVILCGPEGSGRRQTLRCVAEQHGMRFLLLDITMLEEGQTPPISDWVAGALLTSCFACILLREEQRPLLLQALGALSRHRLSAVVLIDRLRSNLVYPGYLSSRLSYEEPNLERSAVFWQHFGDRLLPGAPIDWQQLAGKYVLTPGRMEQALANAAAVSRRTGTPATVSMIDQAVLLGNTNRLSEIADPVKPFFKWEHLILSERSTQQLKNVCNRIKYRYQVETQWGFQALHAYGRGVSVLLYGPPGTGKTMSAQIIAGELNLPLYRINLAQIISKYIGETSKNLDNVFNEARSSNVILFFDEADALFSKRTEVKDSHDRYANSESSYLLQKIEEYSGVSILATNLASNFDDAFLRRINYMVNIHLPGPAQRLELWQKAIPPQAPVHKDLDLGLFAAHLEISGSVIKAAALQAAYLAADEGSPITMLHLVASVRLELQKLGKPEPHFMHLYPESHPPYPKV